MEEDKLAKTAAESVGIGKEESSKAEEEAAPEGASGLKKEADAAEEQTEESVRIGKEESAKSEEEAAPEGASEAKEASRAAVKKTEESADGDKAEPEAAEKSAEASAGSGTKAGGIIDGAPECPLSGWRRGDPFRILEADYICSRSFPVMPKVTAGELQVVFSLADANDNNYVFLLVFDRAFPEDTADGGLPVRVYLVVPSAQELEQIFGKYVLKSIKTVGESTYIDFSTAGKKLFSAYRQSKDCRKSFTQALIELTEAWLNDLIKSQAPSVWNKMGTTLKSLFSKGSNKSPGGGEESGADKRREPNERLHKYVDGRVSQGASANSRCRKVVLSDRALVQIFNESRSRIVTETGGLLLGHYDCGVWYVVEASDPGAGACFEVAYHEADEEYQNHVCAVISRIYKHQLQFLGMWHRHPGSLDVFSGTDDRTNRKYADDVGNGCISALINYDPHFRITFYYVEQINGQPYYTKVDWEAGDDKILNKEIMRIATLQEIEARYE